MTRMALTVATLVVIAACSTERRAPADSAGSASGVSDDTAAAPAMGATPPADTTGGGAPAQSPARGSDSTRATPPQRTTPRTTPPAESAAPPASRAGETAAAHAPGTRDTLLGSIHVVGSFPAVSVVVDVPGEQRVTLQGSLTNTLKNVVQTETEVRGTWQQGGAFQVDSFIVRRASGENVVDGVLVRDGDGIAIRTGTGTLPMHNPPAAFENMIGARVWVGGPLDTGPNPYGIISRP